MTRYEGLRGPNGSGERKRMRIERSAPRPAVKSPTPPARPAMPLAPPQLSKTVLFGSIEPGCNVSGCSYPILLGAGNCTDRAQEKGATALPQGVTAPAPRRMHRRSRANSLRPDICSRRARRPVPARVDDLPGTSFDVLHQREVGLSPHLPPRFHECPYPSIGVLTKSAFLYTDRSRPTGHSRNNPPVASTG
jgi:hypothetical protein